MMSIKAERRHPAGIGARASGPLRTMLSALSALLIAMNSVPALASTIIVVPDAPASKTGAIEAFIPIDRVGLLPVPRGRVVFKGNVAEVSTVPEWQFERQRVLFGPILHTEYVVAGSSATIRGVVLFNQGEWLKFIDDPKATERVVTSTGTHSGRIANVTDTHVELVSKVGGRIETIPLANITDIDSPRVYDFTIESLAPQAIPKNAAFQVDSQAIAFKSSDHPHHLGALKSELRKQSDGDWSTRRLIAIGTLLSAVELAQLVPVLVVPLNYRSLNAKALRQQAQVDAQFPSQ